MYSLDEIKQGLENGTLREDHAVQFKSKLPVGNEDLVAKTLVAFANSGGGFLILGVNDRLKRLFFSDVKESFDEINTFLDAVSKKYTTGVNYSLTIEKICNHKIAIIKIGSSKTSTFFSRHETSPERQYLYTISPKDGKIVQINNMQYKRVYKYMTIESFLLSIYGKSWRFQEPSKWNDKYEQRFYCANYKIDGADGNTPQLFATCVTRSKNSEAAWKVYAHGQGLGAHCLQLELDIVELRIQLRNSGIDIFEKQVEYKDEKYIQDLHLRSSKDYNTYFGNFNFEKFIRLLTLKRDAYTYENEVRIFVIPNMAETARNKGKKALSHDIHIDWEKVIKKVRIDKNCSAGELKAIQQACYTVGIDPVFKSSPIRGGNNCPVGSVKIVFESFDIDDMPGRNGIIIK